MVPTPYDRLEVDPDGDSLVVVIATVLCAESQGADDDLVPHFGMVDRCRRHYMLGGPGGAGLQGGSARGKVAVRWQGVGSTSARCAWGQTWRSACSGTGPRGSANRTTRCRTPHVHVARPLLHCSTPLRSIDDGRDGESNRQERSNDSNPALSRYPDSGRWRDELGDSYRGAHRSWREAVRREFVEGTHRPGRVVARPVRLTWPRSRAGAGTGTWAPGVCRGRRWWRVRRSSFFGSSLRAQHGALDQEPMAAITEAAPACDEPKPAAAGDPPIPVKRPLGTPPTLNREWSPQYRCRRAPDETPPPPPNLQEARTMETLAPMTPMRTSADLSAATGEPAPVVERRPVLRLTPGAGQRSWRSAPVTAGRASVSCPCRRRSTTRRGR